jgi:thiamine-monophosphate kinase
MGDLPKILNASHVSARIDARRIPVAAAVRALFPEKWLDFAMRGGEDYELLFTAPPAAWPALEQAAAQTGGVLTAIGTILARTGDSSTILLTELDGTEHQVSPGAFDHFGFG